MKILKLAFAIMVSFTVSAQQVANFTYLDVPTQEIGKFVRLHKEITDMTIENREFQNHWLLTHFQGLAHLLDLMLHQIPWLIFLLLNLKFF